MGVREATVCKLPKVWRVPQAWIAECDSHMGLMSNAKPRLLGSGYEVWRGLQRRRATDARKDAERHNAEHHPTGQTVGMTTDEPRADYSDVRPGDRLIFERPGGVIYGGAVWQSPTTGAILAGDTFLTLAGAWIDPSAAPDLKVTIDSTHRREGETWNPVPRSKPTVSATRDQNPSSDATR